MSGFIRKIASSFFIVILLVSVSFANQDRFVRVVEEYYHACQNKDINSIAGLLSNSNNGFYHQLINLHLLMFKSLNIEYRDFAVDRIVVLKDHVLVFTKAKLVVYNLDKSDHFKRVAQNVFVLSNTDNPKIERIFNKTNFDLLKKMLIYEKALKMLKKGRIEITQNSKQKKKKTIIDSYFSLHDCRIYQKGSHTDKILSSINRINLTCTMENAPRGTFIVVRWYKVNEDKDMFLIALKLTVQKYTNEGKTNFEIHLPQNSKWPEGDYKAVVYVNEKPYTELKFSVY
ncbi:hypothetical protein [Hippea jasoniae]|uniref:hypothetical protein n=1 Tax=Hippea jasoniae TaxID=944479 RepID=UPI000557DA79|nr:hypothetical protein [Hippea jasoniae]